MTYKIFFGSKPKLSQSDRQMFSRNGYSCKTLLQTQKGMPVGISKSTNPDFPVWKVEHGFSCLVFGSYEQAMEYCHGRFYDLDGKAV